MQQKLNFPAYNFRQKKIGDKLHIYDEIRKKYVCLTPEEWVRQNMIKFLMNEKGYSPGLIGVEVTIKMNRVVKRADIVAYNREGAPCLIVECKSPGTKITQDVFDQIARYNMQLHVNYLIITNGLEHYCCKLDYNNNSYSFLKDIPDYTEIHN